MSRMNLSWEGVYDDAVLAAEAIQEGRRCHWQPGDGTNYVLGFAVIDGKKWLICTTVKFMLPYASYGPHIWMRFMPRGAWPGLRPLLKALEMTSYGDTTFNRERDRRMEAEMRAELAAPGTGSEVLSSRERADDAALGAVVRHMLTARGIPVDAVAEAGENS